jgi:hypothetical protein
MSQILQMGVDDVYFLVQRLGSDCDDYQQYRELTQNAIEAVLWARRDGLLGPDEGEVIWDVDWYALEANGVYRACISDNGDGMSRNELYRYINTLSASGGVQSLVENYGVGAKIAAATRNPDGLVYQSWQRGEGVLAQLVIDHKAREVGFRRWEIEDGVFEDILTVKPELRPAPIAEHGVSVSLLGTHQLDHTFLGPQRLDTPYKSWWLFRALNRRYFRLPCDVKVRVFQTWDPKSWPKSREELASGSSLMRKVFGQEYYLNRYALAKGTVPLTGATAYFYVMDPEKGMDQRQFFEVAGHVAALYKNELLEMRTGNAGRKVLQNFGAVFSAKHLVIYVEPHLNVGKITTNTARTELILNGSPLPWMDWADEFRENLPPEIKELEHEIAIHGSAKSHADTIRERLKKIKSLYRVTRYKPYSIGLAFADIGTIGNVPKPTGKARSKAATSRTGGSGGQAGSEYLAGRKDEGSPAKPIDTHAVEPITNWHSVEDGTRDPGDMEDRAARYLFGEHRLMINADFRVFTDLVDYFCKQYSNIPGVKAVVTDTVHEWFEQQLVEAVMGIRAIEGSKLWDNDQITSALSEEALTTAAIPRYHTWASVKRELGRKLVTHTAANP